MSDDAKPMDLRRLKKIIAVLRAAGVQEYAEGGVRIRLAPLAQVPMDFAGRPEPMDLSSPDVSTEVDDQPEPTLDELEGWSAGR